MRWSRTKNRLGDTIYSAGDYQIERFDGLAGPRHIFVLTGPAGEHKKTTLRDAKWEAEKHARKAEANRG